MKKLFGKYDLINGTHQSEKSNIVTYSDKEVTVQICGQVKCGNRDDINCRESIKELYYLHNDKITKYLRGLYIIVIYDKKSSKLLIAHDRTTSPITLYYIEKDHILYYGTSLKTLLVKSGIKRALNRKATKEFIVNGFTNNKYTLIENVYKLETFHTLHADQTGVEIIPAEYMFNHHSEEEGKEKWFEVLDDAILKNIDEGNKVSCPLSSGYDSNLILHSVKKQTGKPVNAFSVGGESGTNEHSNVRRILQHYDDVNLYTAFVNKNTLQHLPDIVWRLEGAVFEIGIFLQYELFKCIKSCDVSSIIFGECADQVMNPNYWEDAICMPQEPEDNEIPFYRFVDFPFQLGSLVILKKNGLMANSYHIEGKYPYLEYNFLGVANAVKKINGQKKEYHKERCREVFPDEVIKNVMKVGGTTDSHSLFKNRHEIKKFIQYTKKTDFFNIFKEYFTVDARSTKRRSTSRYKDFVKTLLFKIFGFRKEQMEKKLFDYEEMIIKKYLCCMYIILFESLFISGKYDDKFGDDSISLKLDDFLYQRE